MTGVQTPPMQRILRCLYLLGLVALIAPAIVYPHWVGRIYNQPNHASDRWMPGGVFGLDRERAPLWRPPEVHSDLIHPSVRWPWQPVAGRHTIELDIGTMVYEITRAFVLLGLVCGGIHHFAKASRPDLVLQTAWSLALALLIAGAAVAVVVGLSSGYVPNSIRYAILAPAILFGVAHGIWSYRAARREAAQTPQEQETADQPQGESTSAEEVAPKWRRAGQQLLGFSGGILLSLGIMFVGSYIAMVVRDWRDAVADAPLVADLQPLIEAELRALSESDFVARHCGAFQSWRQMRWQRSRGMIHPDVIAIRGTARFEKVDLEVRLNVHPGGERTHAELTFYPDETWQGQHPVERARINDRRLRFEYGNDPGTPDAIIAAHDAYIEGWANHPDFQISKGETLWNILTGIGVALTGGLFGFVCLRRWRRQGLGWGLSIGAALAGLAMATAH